MGTMEINHSVLSVRGVQEFLRIQNFFVVVPNTNKECVLN